MIQQRLGLVLNIVLAAVTLEDTLLFLMAWLAPDLWFRVFHHSSPSVLEVAFLRRSAGQWLAFAVGQSITLAVWRKQPMWLAITAGLRFSDFFTDLSYVLSAPALTAAGYACLLPPPLLNAIFFGLLLWQYRRSVVSGQP